MLEQFLALLVGLIATWLTGQHTKEHRYLAATNQVNYLLWMFNSLFTFVGIGATAVVARFIGAGQRSAANRTMHQALLAGAGIAVVAGALIYLFGRDLLAALQLSPEATDLAINYLSIIVPVLPLVMLEQVGNACLRGAGDTVTGLVAMTITAVLEASIGSALMLGWGPFPKLGWQGIAYATAISYGVGGLIIAAALARGRYGLKFRRRFFRPNIDLLRRILRIGIPGGIDVMALIACQLGFLSIVNQLGDLSGAAHGVTIRIEALAYLPGTAFQVAATTLAGQYLGAGEPQHAKRSALIALAWSELFMFFTGILFYFAATPLVCIFVNAEKPDLIEAASPLLRIISLGMPPLAGIQIFLGTLRGAGETRSPLFITMFGFLAIRIPLAIYLTQQIGVRGAWCAMVTDLYVRCGLLAWRFFAGNWQRTRV